MKSYFFNAEPTEDLERYPTGCDREYDADDHAAFFAPLLGKAGVLLGEGDEAPCKITAQGQTLHINAGTVYVKGRMAIFDGTETLAAASGHVVARMNKSVEVRAFQLLIVAEPVQEEGDIYDLPLAQVTVLDDAVGVIDERAYVTARVLGGHRHQAAEIDGVSTPGHTHTAEEIVSGVLEEARVPYLPGWERLTGTQTNVKYTQQLTITSAGFDAITMSIPYAQPRPKRPKRLIAAFCGKGYNSGLARDNIETGDICFVDMSYCPNGRPGGVVGGIGQVTGGELQFLVVPVTDLSVNDVIDYKGHYYTGTTAYRDASGFGWSGFFFRGGKLHPEEPDYKTLCMFYVGNFSFDDSELKFKISGLNYSSMEGSYTLDLGFGVTLYFFD